MDERQPLPLRRLREYRRGHPRSESQSLRRRMNSFTYVRAADAQQAVAELAKPRAKVLGGGTNLVDLMKMGVETPTELIDINRVPLARVEELPEGNGVRLGALARNSDVAEHPLIKTRYPVLSEAIL